MLNYRYVLIIDGKVYNVVSFEVSGGSNEPSEQI